LRPRLIAGLDGCASGTTNGSSGSANATNPSGTSSGKPLPKLDLDTIYVGDRIDIAYADTPTPVTSTTVQVPETGKITVHRGYEIEVANKKTFEVQKLLTELYTTKENIYRQITITVNVLGRTISVGGEVRAPGSFPHDGNVTLLKSINKAGGFTEYADRRKVTVTHLNGDQVTIDCKKAVKDPKLDITLYPGDSVNAPRWHLPLFTQ
jgi:polysaccharide export outer membrane protein